MQIYVFFLIWMPPTAKNIFFLNPFHLVRPTDKMAVNLAPSTYQHPTNTLSSPTVVGVG